MRNIFFLPLGMFLLASCGGSEPPVANLTTSQKTDQAKAYITSLTEAAASCDAASQVVGAAGAASDLVSLYEAAKSAETACLPVGSTIRGLPAPEYLSKAGREKLKAAQGKLGDAYVEKWAMMGQFKKIADGDMKASTISETKQGAERFQALTMVGFAEIYSVLGEEGADSKVLLKAE